MNTPFNMKWQKEKLSEYNWKIGDNVYIPHLKKSGYIIYAGVYQAKVKCIDNTIEVVSNDSIEKINNLSGTMKLKKGSKAAKDFMAKIRSMKNKPKKSKVSGIKKSTRKVFKKNTSVLSGTHTDTKSHNYRISISGNKLNDKFLQVSNELANLSIDIALTKKQLKETKSAQQKTILRQILSDAQRQFIALKNYSLTSIKYPSTGLLLTNTVTG